MTPEHAAFWAAQAARGGTNRWTDAPMLEFDLALVESVINDGDRLIDLGCGTGELFRPFLHRLDHVTAVDAEIGFLSRLSEDARVEAVCADLDDYRPSEIYDVGLLFGVVTHLSATEERSVYEVLAAAVPRGTVLVKNQCGRSVEVIVDGFSEALGMRYSGRYPAVLEQAELLRSYFSSVEVVHYPEQLNRWPNTCHVAFRCRT